MQGLVKAFAALVVATYPPTLASWPPTAKPQHAIALPRLCTYAHLWEVRVPTLKVVVQVDENGSVALLLAPSHVVEEVVVGIILLAWMIAHHLQRLHMSHRNAKHSSGALLHSIDDIRLPALHKTTR